MGNLYKYFFSFLFALLSMVEASAQKMDSLKLALKNAKNDTTRCYTLTSMIEAENDVNLQDKYNSQLIKLTEKNIKANNDLNIKVIYLKYYAIAITNKGYFAHQKGDISKALEYFDQSLKIMEEIEDQIGIANSANNIGFIYSEGGDISKALEYYRRSLKIFEEMKYGKGLAASFVNIGFIYNQQGDVVKGLEYYEKGLKVVEEMHDKKGIASALNNIGYIYQEREDFLKALEYYQKCLKIREEIQDKIGTASSLLNIGNIYRKQGDFTTALDYFHKSLKLREELQDKDGITNSLNNIASLYRKEGQLDEAFKYAKRGLQLSKEIGFPENIIHSARTLKLIYQAQNKYKEAFDMYTLEIKMHDSINNQETQKATIKHQIQYEFDKKEAASKAEQDKKDAKAAQEQLQQKIITYSATTGALLVVLFVSFIYRSKKQKQKVELENSKVKAKNEILEIQQKLLLTQMNPHFIFNSLKSIQNFVLENNTQLASDYISEFGQLMRLILEATRKEYITLEDEIKILEFYLKLERARSGNQFSYEFHIEKYLEDKLDEMLIPSMLLQPIIENAVKHGVKNMEHGGKIDVSFTQQNNELVKIDVLDNGTGLNKPNYKSDGLSISSKIIEERISNFNKTHSTPITYQIEDMKIYNLHGTKVSLTIPMLEDAA